MARIHAFELEDQAWFPSLIREYMTDFLSHMGGWSKVPYVPFVERLAHGRHGPRVRPDDALT